MRKLTSRAIATAAAAAIVLTTMSFEPAAAGYRRSGDDAAAALFFAGMIGTIAAIIASQHYADQPRHTHGPVHGGPRHHGHNWRHFHR
jgi:hypothetical protein